MSLWHCVCVCPGHPNTAPEKMSFGVPKPTDQIPNLRRNDWMSRGALLHFKCFSSGRKKQPIFRTPVDSFWKDRKDHAAMPNPNDTLEKKTSSSPATSKHEVLPQPNMSKDVRKNEKTECDILDTLNEFI